MTGQIVQYVLYTMLVLTAFFTIAGFFLTFHVRKGRDLDMAPILGGLALIAAAAPYIGLFGTVWHIIQALGGIGGGNLNVAAIAKPIGEALSATLWGLACAIPALISHRIILVLLPDDDIIHGPSDAGVDASNQALTGAGGQA